MARHKQAVARYPNGRAKVNQAKTAQLEANERRAREAKAAVLAQPHRVGRDDPRLSDALGRFCVRYKLRSEAYDAGCVYQGMIRRWRVIKGVPGLAMPRVDLPIDDPKDAADQAGIIHCGEDEDEGEAARLTRRINDCNRWMTGASHNGFLAIRAAMADEIDVDATWSEAAKWALLSLAVCLGRLDEKILREGG